MTDQLRAYWLLFALLMLGGLYFLLSSDQRTWALATQRLTEPYSELYFTPEAEDRQVQVGQPHLVRYVITNQEGRRTVYETEVSIYRNSTLLSRTVAQTTLKNGEKREYRFNFVPEQSNQLYRVHIRLNVMDYVQEITARFKS